MKNLRRWVLLLCALISVAITFNDGQIASSQAEALKGPVLLGWVANPTRFVFQDVGADRVWEVRMPDSSYAPDNWSPDGCHILLHGGPDWHILSIRGTALKRISRSNLEGKSGSVSGTAWSLNGRSITFSVSIAETETHLYSIDIATLAIKRILTLSGRVGVTKWLSDSELLYWTYDHLMIWDTQTGKSRVFRVLPYLPTGLRSLLYGVEESPDGEMLAGFYSLPKYDNLKSEMNGYPDNLTPEEKQELENTPKIPGFDIYFADKRPKLHVDTYGQFLQWLAWSPSSEQIVVSTYYVSSSAELNGIYVYSLKTGALRRVGKYPAMPLGETNSAPIIWSPDSRWLAFETPSGHVIYNLVEGKEIKLSQRFESVRTRLEWSPVMDYRNSTCS